LAGEACLGSGFFSAGLAGSAFLSLDGLRVSFFTALTTGSFLSAFGGADLGLTYLATFSYLGAGEAYLTGL
jgi:hypothetical protein